jgi:hypothetical protein
VGTIHYSTLIEGNRLGILEAARAARGELDRTTKAEIELVNYVDALNELDRRLEADGLAFANLRTTRRTAPRARRGTRTPNPFITSERAEVASGHARARKPCMRRKSG